MASANKARSGLSPGKTGSFSSPALTALADFVPAQRFALADEPAGR